MPQEITDNLPMPADVLACYGTPWILIQELCHGLQK